MMDNIGRMPDLGAARRFYAEEIEAVGGLRSRALVEALASVPRERFLGPGPWQIATADPARPTTARYRATEDDDPRRVYHNVAVALDADRQLNNGQPATIAASLDALDLAPGERVLHVGCGVGYYTAVAAEAVGPTGRVLGIEIDPALAERAARHLSLWPQASVRAADGAAGEPGPWDAILVNAGFTQPLPIWLDALGEGGRLLVPITITADGTPVGAGWMLRVTRQADRFVAAPMSPIMIFASPTGRDSALNAPIRQALAKGAWRRIAVVRRDAHAPADTCIVHADGACLSAHS
jgi:protein-L-isoaspartate(D-aspartate) O-methyltransferase